MIRVEGVRVIVMLEVVREGRERWSWDSRPA